MTENTVPASAPTTRMARWLRTLALAVATLTVTVGSFRWLTVQVTGLLPEVAALITTLLDLTGH